MLDYQDKRILKKIIYSKITILIIFIFVILVAKSSSNAYMEQRLTRENLSIAQQELEELDSRRENIETKISDLNTTEGIEKEIRNKFRVAKEGEEMILIIDKDGDIDNLSSNKDGFWSKFLRFLKK